MKALKSILAIFPIAGLLALSSCSDEKKTTDNAPIVAEKVKIGDNELIVAKISKFTDSLSIPLSQLTEELQIVKLDDREEALVGVNHTVISDNYILVKGRNPIPYKLFDKKGKFIANIGAIGQGPGEYNLVYDEQIDEKNGRIYLFPWQTRQILVFDLQGNALEPIPLVNPAPKGRFYVKDDKVGVAILPFPNSPSVAWTQNMKGEVIDSIPNSDKFMVYDFSNELSAFRSSDNLSFFITTLATARADSLYHLDLNMTKLTPKFTIDFEGREASIHEYIELPNHFTGNASVVVYTTGPNGESVSDNKPLFFIVDKNSLKGGIFNLKNDFLGNLEIGWAPYSFNNGYFVQNYEPGSLIETLEKALTASDLSSDMRKKMEDLKNSIGDNDNNYILYAKMK